MKKSIIQIALGFSVIIILVSGCDAVMGADGEDGKIYVEISIPNDIDAYYVYTDAYPDGGYFDTYYEIEEGSYSLEYSFLYYYYNADDESSNGGDGTIHEYYINSWAGYYYNQTDYSDPWVMLNYYLDNGGLVYNYIFTATANSGEPGGLFTDGADGDDSYYSIYLDWNPDNITVSSNGVVLEKTVAEGTGVIQFKDEYRTFSFFSPGTAAVPGLSKSNVIKAP